MNKTYELVFTQTAGLTLYNVCVRVFDAKMVFDAQTAVRIV